MLAAIRCTNAAQMGSSASSAQKVFIDNCRPGCKRSSEKVGDKHLRDTPVDAATWLRAFMQITLRGKAAKHLCVQRVSGKTVHMEMVHDPAGGACWLC
jgi:hypothetical protein